MQAILSRLPSADSLHANRAKLAGLAAGIVGTLVLTTFAQVLYTGQGIGEDPAPAPVVYPKL
ncbi:MAG: hypothetical protein HKN63_09655 [Rhodobacteraceae bacterium]|nr:hypothetical protein [Paracoccaceae bacterium]